MSFLDYLVDSYVKWLYKMASIGGELDRDDVERLVV